MEIKIEKGVPIPELNQTRKPYSELTKTLSDMKVGDSFAVPVSDENLATLQSKIRQSAKRAKIKITARRLTENKKEVLRVWRIAEEGEE